MWSNFCLCSFLLEDVWDFAYFNLLMTSCRVQSRIEIFLYLFHNQCNSILQQWHGWETSYSAIHSNYITCLGSSFWEVKCKRHMVSSINASVSLEWMQPVVIFPDCHILQDIVLLTLGALDELFFFSLLKLFSFAFIFWHLLPWPYYWGIMRACSHSLTSLSLTSAEKIKRFFPNLNVALDLMALFWVPIFQDLMGVLVWWLLDQGK